MPAEMIKEFVGKKCVVKLFNSYYFEGTIVSFEENWIKLDEKKKIRMINVDTISDIEMRKKQ